MRIQSMTSTDTMDTASTIRQCMDLVDAGCEMLRITAPGLREAKQLEMIKNQLVRKGYSAPIIADIHFNPGAALIAAGIVEKVRINPGNYITSQRRTAGNYTDKEYRRELEVIAERMAPLLEACRKHSTVIRIGVNHGSLAERIMQRFGATPEGMVESAIEYASLCRQLGFEDLVLSIKSSDVKQMIYANRLLVQRMIGERMDYPLHLGVTEAGDREDGRIKSAAGIGALLADGIGDTIRVSLTEDPVKEIPVAARLRDQFLQNRKRGPAGENEIMKLPVSYKRRSTSSYENIGAGRAIAVSSELPGSLHGSDAIRTIRIKTTEPCSAGIREPWKAETPHDDRPLLIHLDSIEKDHEKMLVQSASVVAGLLVDGFGDALKIDTGKGIDNEMLELGILQALGLRFFKTEYIACPSCGRTQFNIQAALEEVRKRTAHLKGLKIAVMGCIVNGPGEMADADYGYVGSGRGKVSLYRGKTQVKKNIDEDKAIDELVALIRAHGDWKDS